MNTSKGFHHFVRVDPERQMVVINRVFSDGTTHIYTEISLSESTVKNSDDRLELYATQIGEAILFDSPEARAILNLQQ